MTEWIQDHIDDVLLTLGIVCMGLGAGMAFGFGYGLLIAGALLFGLGLIAVFRQ